MVEWDGRELAGLRHGLYRFFAACLRAPTREGLDQLATVVRRLGREPLEGFPFYSRWHPLAEAFEAGLDLAQVSADYSRLFLRSAPKTLCPCYESAYLSANDGQDAGYIIAGVDQAYRRMGLELSVTHNELPDHLGLELEAMAHLCAREVHARELEGVPPALECLGQQRSFLRRHLAAWAPLFAGRVRSAAQGRYHSLVASAAAAYICHDLDLVEGLTRGAGA